MKKIYCGNTKLKKAGMPVLMSDKVDFKTKDSSRNKEGHFVIVIGPVHQEGITIYI